jgi:hypothetical protein
LRHEAREVYLPGVVAEEIAEKPDPAAQRCRLPVRHGCRCGVSQIIQR